MSNNQQKLELIIQSVKLVNKLSALINVNRALFPNYFFPLETISNIHGKINTIE